MGMNLLVSINQSNRRMNQSESYQSQSIINQSTVIHCIVLVLYGSTYCSTLFGPCTVLIVSPNLKSKQHQSANQEEKIN